MMYTLKWKYFELIVFLLFTLNHGELFRQRMQQQRYNPAVPPHLAPPWEYIVREIILKSVTPSPADAEAPHRRPLDASFYGGPVAVYSNHDENVTLSQGKVYHLLNGHWMLCQDGCVDCKPCVAQGNPSFKWVLRRLKRLPASNPRHDLQLTIMPQADRHFHTSNLWPNSYVYVTSPGATFPVGRTYQDNDSNSSASLENSFPQQHHRSENTWQLKEQDSARQYERVSVQENASTEKTMREKSPRQKHEFKNTWRHRPRKRPVKELPLSAPTNREVTVVNDSEESNQLEPKWILVVDQRGQKQLIHVVPLDPVLTIAHFVNFPAPNRLTSSHIAMGQAARSNKIIPERDGQTYQPFSKVFESLKTHRRSIEDFLESPAEDVNGREMHPSGDNTEVAGFLKNNRDADRTSVDLQATTRLDGASSSSFYATDDGRLGMHRGYGSRHGYDDTKQDMNLGKVLHSQVLTNLDRSRERRKIHIKPYSVDGTRQNTLRINPSISSQSSDYSSAVAVPKPAFGNGLVTNSAKQIDLNDTSDNCYYQVAGNSKRT
ncbi:PREDICTED: uncharacterized protein LOC106750690 [Dinoponera quadriceps]|uniref:Uncharacterized protein LOC106750690 n=1 Tax=Dinoponera quadriceps TaxID=609295 RepID=A0A6P3Y9J5_DINQU|nr:PREDICTED: uncharacterized protein LOC106750690 [Dinoponera quadriceps]